MKFTDTQKLLIELINEFEANGNILTDVTLLKYSKMVNEMIEQEQESEEEFEIRYFAEGSINIKAKNHEDAMRKFIDRVGFSNDDLYENLNHNFLIKSIVEVENE